MEWDTLDRLPEIGQKAIVCAWEFGRAPKYYICWFWQSTLSNQPPKFYLDDTYCTQVPVDIGDTVHYWMPLPEITHDQYDTGNKIAVAASAVMTGCR